MSTQKDGIFADFKVAAIDRKSKCSIIWTRITIREALRCGIELNLANLWSKTWYKSPSRQKAIWVSIPRLNQSVKMWTGPKKNII
jgi:hypothetical protein